MMKINVIFNFFKNRHVFIIPKLKIINTHLIDQYFIYGIMYISKKPFYYLTKTKMEQKVVKLEIGKLIAIIIGVAVIAILATMVLQGGYFKGQLIETDRDALSVFQSNIEKGIDANMVVNDYLATTGKTLNTADQDLLIKRVESDISANIEPSMIASDFNSDIYAIESGIKVAEVNHDAEIEIENLLKNFDSGMAKIETDRESFQIETVGKSIPQFSDKLIGLLKGSEFEKSIDIVKTDIDAKLKEFNAAIDKGIEFDAAFDKYFGSMTLSDFGIEKPNDELQKGFDIIKRDFGIVVGKAIESRDFSVDVDKVIIEFEKGLDSVMSDAPSVDTKVLNDFSVGLDKLKVGLDSGVSIPAYQRDVDVFARDFGFQF